MLEKLTNLFKKEKFFLEIKENTDEVASKVGAVATKVKEEAQQLVEDSKPAIDSAIKDIKSETEDKVQKVKSSTEDSTVDSAQKDKKKELAKSSPAKIENKEDEPKKEAAPSVDTSYSDEPFWVKLMYETSEQKIAAQNAEKTFATDNLISKPKARRRPGGSLDRFKEMARQTNVKS
jgi:hypothetical protein